MEQNKYPPHLSEFFSIVNNKDKGPIQPINNNNNNNNNNVPSQTTNNIISTDSSSRLSTPQTHHRYNNSISSSLNSNSSCLQNLDMIITSKDIEQLTTFLTQLKNVSIKYSKSLETLAHDTLEFSNIINDLTQLKICPNDNKIIKNLLDSSGLFQIITNHHLILANSIKTYLVNHVTDLIDKIQSYYNSTHNKFTKFDQIQSIKLNQLKRDYYHMDKNKKQKSKQRFDDNLIQIRQNLNDLQLQVNEMELNRFNYYQDLIQFNDGVFNDIINKLATISKIHLEISENIARKNWPDGGLDQLLNCSDDILYNNKDSGKDEEEEEINEDATEQVIEDNLISHTNESDTVNNTPTLSASLAPNDDILTTPTSPHKRNDSKTSYFSIENVQNNQVMTTTTESEELDYDEERDQSFSLPLTMASQTNVDNQHDSESESENDNDSDGESDDSQLSAIVSQNSRTVMDQSSI